jgi:hypothetical protein
MGNEGCGKKICDQPLQVSGYKRRMPIYIGVQNKVWPPNSPEAGMPRVSNSNLAVLLPFRQISICSRAFCGGREK